jgi:hypothetical protein
MTSLVLANEPAALQVAVTDEQLIVSLVDGRTLSVPLEWYPRLAHATPLERANLNIMGEGYVVEWPNLDEHIGMEGLLAGRRSGESAASLQRWLTARMSQLVSSPQ